MGGINVNVDANKKRIIELALPPVELSKSQVDQLSRVTKYADDKGIEIAVKIVK